MQIIDAFVTVIRHELNLLNQLLLLGRHKQKAVSDVTELEEIVSQERILLEELRQAEQERVRLLDASASGQDLHTWLQKEERSDIAELIAELEAKYSHLQSVNILNQQLIRESLAFVQFNLNILVDDRPLTYTKPGTKNPGKSIIDRKV